MTRGGIFIELKKQLLEEQERLAKIIKNTRYELRDMPEGRLRIGKSKGCTQYYHCKKDLPHNGVYLPKKDIELARQLAQKSYNEKIIRYAEKTYMRISKLLGEYEDEKIEQIFLSEHPEKQKLIVPVEEIFQQRLDKWISQPYVRKGFNDDAPVIMTNNGLRVRSKSEKIMADYFESIGLAFKYECPLYIKPYGTIYPDFTFLSKRTGKEVYWEHEGMLDNPEYAKNAVKKIELYETNGIYQGENLILTFESSVSAINIEIMKNLTRRYLL
ncbi:MAG: hypothetical protein ACI4D4_06725 [Lachnospira sp.]